jgi:hypothetical protein
VRCSEPPAPLGSRSVQVICSRLLQPTGRFRRRSLSLLVRLKKMCHLLTIAVPCKTVPEVPSEFRRKIHFTEQTNRSVTKHAPIEWISFTATSGGCSCDFYRASDTTEEDISKLEKKYRKKGWSDAKIQRALESHGTPATRRPGLRDDILDLVTDLVKAFGEIRLSLHWYSGDAGMEKFALNDAGCISLEDFRRDTTALGDETTIKIQGEQVSGGNGGQRR